MSGARQAIEIFLQPGELYFGDRDTRIRTLLGSCVAIVMWHPARRIGGMCHFMLPARPGGAGNGEPDARYADEAMLLFLREIAAAGTRATDYEVRLIGGGDQFPEIDRKDTVRSVPQRNLEVARALTAQHGFHIKAEDLGGTGGRNVIFDVSNGHVWVRALKAPAGVRKRAGGAAGTAAPGTARR